MKHTLKQGLSEAPAYVSANFYSGPLSWTEEYPQQESIPHVCVFPHCQFWGVISQISRLHTERESLCERSKLSEHGVWSPSHRQCLQVETWHGSQARQLWWWHESGGMEVQQSSEHGLWYSHAQALNGWSGVLIIHNGWRSHSHRCPDGILIQVSTLVVLDILGPSKGIPVIPHYLSLGIVLDITVMADSDSILDCQRHPESLLCSCSM